MSQIPDRRISIANITQWLLVIVSLAWNLRPALRGEATAPTTLFLFALVFLLIHGARRYGAAGLAVFVVVTAIVSNAYENCSILTGFPFGHYHYTGTPKLFEVPVVVGPFYVAMGYLAWQTANVLLGSADERLREPLNLVLLPALAGVTMTMIDLTLDPQTSTMAHSWIWEQGGGYFGVPYTNFLGWWLTTYTFFQIFALYLRARNGAGARVIASRQFWLQPLILYVNLGLCTVISFFASTADAGAVADVNGVVWKVRDIYETTMIVFLFTMVVVAVLALARLFQPGSAKQ